jgi:WD40 repeat protein
VVLGVGFLVVVAIVLARVLGGFPEPDRPLPTFTQERPDIVWIQGGGIRSVPVGHAFGVTSVVFSPDGRLLASGSYDYTIKLWRVEDGSLVRTLTGHRYPV